MTVISFFRILCGVLLCLLNASQLFSQGEKSQFSGKVLVIPVTNESITDGRRLRELNTMLDEAGKQEADAVIFDLNVTGPVDWEAQKRLLDMLPGMKTRSIAFVNSAATGPGAFIALACDSIYVTDAAIMGGAGPDIAASGEKENEEAQKRKFAQRLSILKARARSLAKKRGHNVAVAEAFIDGEMEVKIGESVISEKGSILTLTADEAVRVIGGHPLLAEAIVGTVEEILKQEKIAGEIVRLSPREFGEKKNRTRLSQPAKDEEKKNTKTKESEGKELPGLFSKRDSGDYKDKIVILKIGQEALATGKASFEFMDRILRKAELDGAKALILDVDTPGGYAWYTEGLVLNSLQDLSYPTYTFVNTRAESAGAIIAVATDHIYMRPAATIGSALVVSGSGGDLSSSMNDKVTQMIIATVRNVAEIKGHNPDIAEAFVTQDKEVKIDGTVIHEKGKVLNLNTIRATEEIGGRPVLAKGVAKSIDDLIAQESLKGEKIMAEALGLEAFANLVQKFSFALIMIGFAGAYLEMKVPGFSLPGLVSVIAFGLFFFGNYAAGNLAGYELAVLLVIGLILLAVEIFLFPGAMIPGIVGAILIFTSLGLAMVDRVDFQWKMNDLPSAASWTSLFSHSLMTLALGLCGAFAAILLAMRYLPDSRLGSWLILNRAVPAGASIELVGVADEGEEETSIIGWKGKTITDLRPAGKGKFKGRLLDIISDGEFISKGNPVIISKQEGSRIVVRLVT